MKTPEEVKRDLFIKARNSSHNMFRNINGQVAAYRVALEMVNKWTRSGKVGACDSTFPIYVTLQLDKNDDLCKEGMLFVEEFIPENRYLDDFRMQQDGDYFMVYYSNFLRILFAFEEAGRCRVINKKVEAIEKVLVCS